MNKRRNLLLSAVGLVGIATLGWIALAGRKATHTPQSVAETRQTPTPLPSQTTPELRSLATGTPPIEIKPGVSLVRDPANNDLARIRTGTLIVAMRPDAREGSLAELASTQGFAIARNLGGDAFIVTAPNDTLASLQQRLQSEKSVEFAEYDFLTRGSGLAKADPLAHAQPIIKQLGLDRAWAITRGEGVTIAIIDSGIELDHEDLVANLVPGHDFVENDEEPQDEFGHGTACAGIAAARGMNGLGISGVAPDARIMPIRVLDEDGVGTYSDLADGIVWAAEHGAKVISVSLGAYVPSAYLARAVRTAQTRGALIVASVGNDALTRSAYPAALPGVLGVGAVDEDGIIAGYTNAGKVDLVAPGDGILTTTLNHDYAGLSGTSSATPVVAGIAALLAASSPGLRPEAIAKRLIDTTDAAGRADERDTYGAGRVNALRAVGGLSKDVAISRLEVSPFPAIGKPTKARVVVQNRGVLSADVVVNLDVRGVTTSSVVLNAVPAGGIQEAVLDAQFDRAVEQEVSAWIQGIDDETSNNRIKQYVIPVEEDSHASDLAIQKLQFTKLGISEPDGPSKVIVTVQHLAGTSTVSTGVECFAQPQADNGEGGHMNVGDPTPIGSTQFSMSPAEIRKVAVDWQGGSIDAKALAVSCRLTTKDRDEFNDRRAIHVVASDAGEIRAFWGGGAHGQAMNQGIEWLRMEDPNVKAGLSPNGILAEIDNNGYKSKFKAESDCEDSDDPTTGCVYNSDSDFFRLWPQNGGIWWVNSKYIEFPAYDDRYFQTLDHFWDGDDDPYGENYIQWHHPITGTAIGTLYPRGGINSAMWKALIILGAATKYYGDYADTNDGNAKAIALRMLGRVLHLTQDMGVPAHALNDMHPSTAIYEDGDQFENYYVPYNYSSYVVDSNWRNADKYANRMFALNFDYPDQTQYWGLRRVMFMNNQAAQVFGSDDVLPKPNVPSVSFSNLTSSDIAYTVPAVRNLSQIMHTIFPQVIRSTAEVLKIFEKFVILPRDKDLDGVPNNFDNCPQFRNPNQDQLCPAIWMSTLAALQ